MATNSVRMTSTGISTPIPVRADKDSHPFILPPGVILNFSSGASATASVVVTGDDINAQGYTAASGVWNVFDGMGSLTASANGTLAAKVTAIALQVTVYASGTITLQVIQ